MSKYTIKLTGCDCISQDDKEILINMAEDAVSLRRERYELAKKPAEKDLNLALLKMYEPIKDFVSNFKTCR